MISTPEVRRHRAQQRADPVDRQADGEAPLASPAVGQLAARDHQRRHHQQEQRDRRLHALHRGVEVLADVVDHHVHVRAGEAADELGEGQGQQRPAQRRRHPAAADRLCRRHGLGPDRAARGWPSAALPGRPAHPSTDTRLLTTAIRSFRRRRGNSGGSPACLALSVGRSSSAPRIGNSSSPRMISHNESALRGLPEVGRKYEAVKQRAGFKLTLVHVGRRRRPSGSIAQEVGARSGWRPPTTAVMPSPDT